MHKSATEKPLLSLEGFRDFLLDDPKHEIDNISWSSCAFGQYTKSQGIHLPRRYTSSASHRKSHKSHECHECNALQCFENALDDAPSTRLDDVGYAISIYECLNTSEYLTHQDILDDLNAHLSK